MADESPLASLFPAGSLEAAAITQMQKEKQAQLAAQKQQMDLINQQAQRYGQTGMSDLDKASIFFQAAGALAAPTRSGALMESIGSAGTAVSGPLAKAAQAQREREDKVVQLQMARAKLAGEMGTGDLSGADMLQLAKMRAEAAGKPSEFERNLKYLSEEEQAKARRINAGLEEKAGAKKKEISDTLITEMGNKGSAVFNLEDLSDRFKPEYAGKMANAAGDLQNIAGSRGIGWKDQAIWWSDWAEKRNEVRKELFGSALTATEKAEFEKADIQPGMAPEVIKEKLARQREAARRAAYKIAKAKEVQGYDIAPLETALGYKLSDLEGAPAPKKDTAGGSQSAQDRLKLLEEERKRREAQGQ
jgi:hypothetical protein